LIFKYNAKNPWRKVENATFRAPKLETYIDFASVKGWALGVNRKGVCSTNDFESVVIGDWGRNLAHASRVLSRTLSMKGALACMLTAA